MFQQHNLGEKYMGFSDIGTLGMKILFRAISSGRIWQTKRPNRGCILSLAQGVKPHEMQRRGFAPTRALPYKAAVVFFTGVSKSESI